ncbi:hypothetical protein [Flavitalea sp.]|nr:hypothetical protein [Flavitalea sp.]
MSKTRLAKDAEERLRALIERSSAYCFNSRNYAVMRAEGHTLAVCCGRRDYKVLFVDEEDKSYEYLGYDFVTDNFADFLFFLNKKFNEFLTDIQQNGTDRQKKAFGLL